MTAKRNIETVVKSLKKNNFKVEYFERTQDAIPVILDLIPADASIEMAGSVSVGQLGLFDMLRKRGNKGLDFSDPEAFSFEEMRKNRKDVLLASTNAVTLDGKLVNTDGMGNRIAAMFFGVKKVKKEYLVLPQCVIIIYWFILVPLDFDSSTDSFAN